MGSCRLNSSQEKFGMQTIMVALLTRIMDLETVSHVALDQLSHTKITIPCQRNHHGMPTGVGLLHLPILKQSPSPMTTMMGSSGRRGRTPVAIGKARPWMPWKP